MDISYWIYRAYRIHGFYGANRCNGPYRNIRVHWTHVHRYRTYWDDGAYRSNGAYWDDGAYRNDGTNGNDRANGVNGVNGSHRFHRPTGANVDSDRSDRTNGIYWGTGSHRTNVDRHRSYWTNRFYWPTRNTGSTRFPRTNGCNGFHRL